MTNNENVQDTFDMSLQNHKHTSTISNDDEPEEAFDMSQYDHQHTSTISGDSELQEGFNVFQMDHAHFYTISNDRGLEDDFDTSLPANQSQTLNFDGPSLSLPLHPASSQDKVGCQLQQLTSSDWEDIPFPGHSDPPQDTTPDESSRASSPQPDFDPATKLIVSRLVLLGQHSDYRPCFAALRRRTDWMTGEVLDREVFANVDDSHVYSVAPISDTASTTSSEEESEKWQRRFRTKSRKSSPERVLQQKQAVRLKESLELSGNWE